MDVRNWVDLSRKLIDRQDFLDSFAYIVDALKNDQLARFSKGIVPCAAYPSPFVTTLSGAAMTGTITAGMFFDPAGQRVEVGATQNFTLTADATNPRKAYLVARFLQEGQTTIPKPSDPLNNVFLDLVDTFELEVLLGTPAGSPAYPTLGADDIVLMGFTIPAAETLASNCTEDSTVRDQGVNESSAVFTSNQTLTPFTKLAPFNANSGALQATLPKGKFSEGAEITIAKTDSSVNKVTYRVDPTTTDTLAWGSTSETLDAKGASVTLKCKAGVWYEI